MKVEEFHLLKILGRPMRTVSYGQLNARLGGGLQHSPWISRKTSAAAFGCGCSRYVRRDNFVSPLSVVTDATTQESKTEAEQPTKSISSVDATVLRELLNDPEFLASVELKKGFKEEVEAREEVTPASQQRSRETPRQTSEDEFSSRTVQALGDISLAWGSMFAKVTAALESATIFIQNKAQSDINTVLGIVNVAAGRALLTLGTTLSPTTLLLGGNSTALDSEKSSGSGVVVKLGISLLELGLNPFEEVRRGGKLLGSLQGFDNDDDRLEAAYKRGRRRRKDSLPEKILGAIPSVVQAADDLAYEVETEVRYERPGRALGALLRKVGLSLPADKISGSISGSRNTDTLPGARVLRAEDDNTIDIDINIDENSTSAPRTGFAGWIFDQLVSRPDLLAQELAYATEYASAALSAVPLLGEGRRNIEEREYSEAASAAREISTIAGVEGDREDPLVEQLEDVLLNVKASQTETRQELEQGVQKRKRLLNQYRDAYTTFNAAADALEIQFFKGNICKPLVEEAVSQLVKEETAVRTWEKEDKTREKREARASAALDLMQDLNTAIGKQVGATLQAIKAVDRACLSIGIQNKPIVNDPSLKHEENMKNQNPPAWIPQQKLNEIVNWRERAVQATTSLPERLSVVTGLQVEFENVGAVSQEAEILSVERESIDASVVDTSQAEHWSSKTLKNDRAYNVIDVESNTVMDTSDTPRSTFEVNGKRTIDAEYENISVPGPQSEVYDNVFIEDAVLEGEMNVNTVTVEAVNAEIVVESSQETGDVIDITDQSVVEEGDSEVRRKAALKTLDVLAILIERIVFVILPALLNGGGLAAERVRIANNPEGGDGWHLHMLLKDPSKSR